jgi:hypothetical protein
MHEFPRTLIDLSDMESRRRTFRRLLMAFVGLVALGFVLAMFSQLPDSVQMAVAFESEVMPAWRFWVLAIVYIGLFALTVWALVDLWQFRAIGIAKFMTAVFVPEFLVNPLPTVETPLSAYLIGMGHIVTGMVLFMCWTQPELFGLTAGASKSTTPAAPPATTEPK